MTITALPILAAPNLIDETHTGDGYGTVRLSGGSFEPTRPRSYLQDALLVNAARTTSAAASNTWLNIDIGHEAPVKLLAVPRHNLSRLAQFRLLATTKIAFSGITVNGVHFSGVSTVSMTAGAQTTIFYGDAFTIAGDATLYQASSSVGFGENRVQNSYAPNSANWVAGGDGSSFTNATGISDPFGGLAAKRFGYTSGGFGLIRISSSTTFTSSNTYNVAFAVRLNSLTRSSGTAVITVAIGGGTAVTLSDSDIPLGEWVRVNKDVVAGGSGNFIDIQKGANVSAYSIDLIAMQATSGSGVKDYCYTGASPIATSTLTQNVPIVRVDSATTGLAAITSGGEAVTARSGRIDATAAELQLDTGILDVWEDYFDSNQPLSGDKKFPANQAALHPQPLVWINQNDGETVDAQYWRLSLFDSANADGYVSLARLVMAGGYEPTVGVQLEVDFGRFSASTITESKGGAKVSNRQEGGRAVRIGLPYLSEDEALMEMWRMLTDADITDQIFFAFDKTDTRHKSARMFLARARSINPMLLHGFDRISAAFELQEVVA